MPSKLFYIATLQRPQAIMTPASLQVDKAKMKPTVIETLYIYVLRIEIEMQYTASVQSRYRLS